MKPSERDVEICFMYQVAGLTVREIANLFAISASRVSQITNQYLSDTEKKKRITPSRLAKRAERVFQFIVKYKEDNDGNSPTFRQITAAADVSNMLLYQALIYLEETGQIKRGNPRHARSFTVVGGKWTYGEVK